MRSKRGGGFILAGEQYYWTNWDYEQRILDMCLLEHPCYAVPNEWLSEMFDDQCSAHLLPMPMENCS